MCRNIHENFIYHPAEIFIHFDKLCDFERLKSNEKFQILFYDCLNVKKFYETSNIVRHPPLLNTQPRPRQKQRIESRNKSSGGMKHVTYFQVTR